MCNIIINTHSSDPPPFKKGGVNFNYHPWRGGGVKSEKLEKEGGSVV